jgi:hypothetical protein
LLKNGVAAEMKGVRNDYTIIFSRYGRNKAMAATRTDAPGGREADAKRLAAVIKAITEREPKVYRNKDGITIECYEGHLEGFMRFVELADAIEKWLEETSRR